MGFRPQVECAINGVESMLETISYRTVMQEALRALAAMTEAHDRLEKRHYAVLDERRAAQKAGAA